MICKKLRAMFLTSSKSHYLHCLLWGNMGTVLLNITHIFVAKLWVLKFFNSSKNVFIKEIFLQGKRIIWLTYINETFWHMLKIPSSYYNHPQKSWFPFKMSPMWKKYCQSHCLSSNWGEEKKKTKQLKIKEKKNKQKASSTFLSSLKELWVTYGQLSVALRFSLFSLLHCLFSSPQD